MADFSNYIALCVLVSMTVYSAAAIPNYWKGFNDSLASAVLDLAAKQGYSAAERLQQANSSLSIVQDKLSDAETLLSEKKEDFDDAEKAYISALDKLRKVDRKLEKKETKKLQTIEKNKRSRRNVNQNCKNACPKICFPFLEWHGCCFRVWGYCIGCPRWNACFAKIFDFICTLKCEVRNALGRLIQSYSYSLEKIIVLSLNSTASFLGVTMAEPGTLDWFSNVISFEYSRAQLSMEIIKNSIFRANSNLGFVKTSLNGALNAHDFANRNGPTSIIAVRNCEIDLISAGNNSEFNVQCEVNAFDLGFETVSFRVDFNRFSPSLWDAAKGILTYAFTNVRDRKKRSSTNITLTPTVDLNVELCKAYKTMYKFLKESVVTLQVVANATVGLLESSTTGIDFSMNCMTPEDIINTTAALENYNITREMLVKALKHFKKQRVVKALESLLRLVDNAYDTSVESVGDFDLLAFWQNFMENVTREAFENATCGMFSDCVLYSIEQLAVNSVAIDKSVSDSIKPHLERLYSGYSILLNTPRMDASHILITTQSLLRSLESLKVDADDIFCGTPPTITSELENKLIIGGSNITLRCLAEGTEPLHYFWLKDGEIIENAARNELDLVSVTEKDGGFYMCVVSNHVGRAYTRALYSVYSM